MAGKYLIDIITGYQIQKLPLLLCIMIGSTVFSLGFESVINRISTKLGIAINNDIQADIFDKIVDADWLEISKYANGDVLNRFNGDIGTVSGNAISWLPTIIIAVYRFIATFFVILHYDWVMALIAFLSAPFLLLMSRFMIRRQREYSKEVREMSSNLMSFEVEAFYNFDTIKSFGIAPYYSKKMRWWQGLFKDISLKYNLFTIKTNIVMSILGSAVEFTAFGYCLFRLWTHDITYGTMTLFLQQRSNLSGAFGNVISIIPSFLNSSVSAHRIRELVELPKEVHIPESAALDPLAKDGFRVQMHGVEFSYIEGNKVITRSEFQAAPGEIVALVGPSGEGKTTMIRLILGLIRPQEGETVIIASNGKTVPMNAETRHLFAYVPQGNTILSGTIAENMRMVKRMRPTRRSSKRSKSPAPGILFSICRIPLTAASGNVAAVSPKASPSGLPSPVPSSAMPRCCFWMKPPRHWTLRRNETFSETSSASVPTKPASLRRTARVSSASAREFTVS